MYKPKTGTLAEVFLTEEKKQHGGKRPGSGPKPKGIPQKEVFALRLPPEVSAWAKTQRRHLQDMIEQEYRQQHADTPQKPTQRD